MEDIFIKIQKLRKERRLTLKELSTATGLSISFLSQVERGTTSLAITSLKKIADALEVPMVYFFEEERDVNYAVYKKDQHPFRIGSSDSTLIRLSSQFPERKIDAFIITLDPKHKDPELVQHPGEEFYYVLEGEVLIYIHDKTYLLKKGDAIHFPSTIPHKWENPLDSETTLISSVTPAVF
ncbi:transcriptional regulator with XRE-family HTH domain [Bacillus thermophilus]|jgi:transcriptional regulator with XRE-family HTH domain|uniref:Transcriptional regulator with XRE-family HTH domain n=1 Tax=Siminovitchia thermophila TaxID=1245522 RepID=A0ABS2R5J6_9BACI|nr:cupin domain-containing protein [Siminovitchia thermophila]MBM7714863.1 transcriptional regulator with XRE-family HTH domain [Siminovitchia thermophila]ONK21747.1 DNA-binding protein [Bacillus sp. VT-16-64]